MFNENSAAEVLIAGLSARASLSEVDRDILRAMPFAVRTYEPSAYLVREGQFPQRCATLLSGYAYRQKLTEDGARQIVALLVPGDIVDLQNLQLAESDHSVQALTRLVTAEVPIVAMRDLSTRNPAIAAAIWASALAEASIAREWILNIGRRDARTRLAHLLCEFELRVQAVGIPTSDGYDLPLTQEQLADTLGLTPVHVNRVLKGLEREGLIDRQRRRIQVSDSIKLRAAAGFNERYLHLRPATVQPV